MDSDSQYEPEAVPARSVPTGRILGLLGVAFLLVVCLWPRRAWDPVEVGAVLAAESWIQDGDLSFGPEDELRWQEWRQRLGDDSVPFPQLVAGSVGRFSAPLGQVVLLAPLVVVAGARGALAAQGLALLVGLLLVARYGRTRLHDDTVVVVAGFFGLSCFLPAAAHLWPEVLLAVEVAALLALLYSGESRPGAAPDLYGGSPTHRWFETARWIGVGILFGLLVVSMPALVALVLPIVFVIKRRRPGALAIALGTIGMAILVWSSGTVDGAAWDSLWRGLAVPEWGLLAWSAVDLSIGRHVGVLFYFAPLLLLLSCGREPGRRSLSWGVLLATILLLVGAPYRFSGAPWTVGARAFLPLFAALWFLVDRPPARWLWVPTAMVAGAVLWPNWLHLTDPVADAGGRPLRTPSYLSPWLPWETTQVGLAAESAVATDGIEVRVLNLGGWRGADAQLRLMGGSWADLLLVAPQPVGGFRLEVGEEGGADLELRGGELRQSVYRPDGSVGFLVDVEPARRYHSLPGHEGVQYFQPIAVRLKSAPLRPIDARVVGVELTMPGERVE